MVKKYSRYSFIKKNNIHIGSIERAGIDIDQESIFWILLDKTQFGL